MKARTRSILTGATIAAAGAVPSAAFAQETPDLTLVYRQLDDRQTLKFVSKAAGEQAKPVGWLHWDFPPASLFGSVHV